MPSETVYLSDDPYQYALSTCEDGQTVNKRLQELITKGIESESND